MPERLRRWALRLAWACVPILAFLSLAPLTADHRTGAGAHFEHLLAYAGTAFLFGAAERYRPAAAVVGLMALAAALEAMQGLTPARRPSLQDLAWGALGAVAGGAAWQAARALLGRFGLSPAGRRRVPAAES